MSPTDRARAHLYERLDQALGTDAADSLMDHLPPVGWADVATKHDLNQLELRLEMRIDARMDALDAKLSARMDQLDARTDQLDARFDHLETHVDLRIDALEQRLAAALERGIRQGMLATIGAVVTLLTIAAVLTQLLG